MADSEDSSQTGQKRRRVEQEFIRDEKLWMEDGNVVLAASAIDETSDEKTTHVFKCHRSILAMQSKIFEGLLSMPPSTATHDMHDGLPLVALPDAYADVRDLLYILYDIEDVPRTDRNRWDICKTRKIMQKVQGPLRLAVKYEFTKLRARLTYVIESLWPVSLSQMDSRYSAVAKRRQTGYRAGEEQPAADFAIALAYETGISSILPGAFYTLSVESYYVGGQSNTGAIQQNKVVTRMENLLGKLPSPFVVQFLAGRESLRETAKTLLEEVISEATLHNRSCTYTNNSEYADSEDDNEEEDEMRETRCAPIIEKWWDDVLLFTRSATYDPLHHMLLLERECKDIECLAKGPSKSMCHRCKDAILQSIRIAREHLWNELPYLFSIKERDPSVNYGCQARLTPLFTYVP